MRDQLSGLTGGVTASFSYDGVGRRTSKTVNGTTTSFLYDGANLVQELSGTTVTANYLTGLAVDEVFSRSDASRTVAYLSDGLGSTLGLADSGGTVQTGYSYGPFGNPTSTGAASSNAVQYTGLETDRTGLPYDRARYYSPTLQRFISQDPLGLGGGDANLYSYTGNDPVNATDATGLITMADGTPAHALIEEQFLAYNLNWVAEATVYSILNSSYIKPNLLNPNTNVFYEIKHNEAGQIKAGQNQIAHYENWSQKICERPCGPPPEHSQTFGSTMTCSDSGFTRGNREILG